MGVQQVLVWAMIGCTHGRLHLMCMLLCVLCALQLHALHALRALLWLMLLLLWLQERMGGRGCGLLQSMVYVRGPCTLPVRQPQAAQ